MDAKLKELVWKLDLEVWAHVPGGGQTEEWSTSKAREESAKLIAEYFGSMEWISVKDKLPEIGEEVIVLTYDNQVTALARKIRYEEDKEFTWDNHYPGTGNWYAMDAITHWMKFPSPIQK